MARRTRVIGLVIAVVGGGLTGCFLDDAEEADCGGIGGLAAVADGCADTSDVHCVGETTSDDREIRVDSYDVRLPSGGQVHSAGADFDADPPLVTLAMTGGDDIDATLRDFSVGQRFESMGERFRIASFCDTGVTWLIPT